jgi:hypothetical protein
VSAAAFGLTLLLAGAPAAASGPAPRIRVEPASFDFGRLLPWRTLHKQFLVRNFGTADLAISGVSTTCGCTAALLDRRSIKPGRAATLRVTFDTRDDRGKVTRSVLLESNDPAHPRLELKLEATVVEPEATRAR